MSCPGTSHTEPRIVAIGVDIARRRVANEEHIESLGITRQFLHSKLGVLRRAVKEPEERTSDLCVRAYQDLVSREPLERGGIGLVCVVTQNPDQRIPHTAAILHDRLGLGRDCMTFDISQGCAGYVHGLAIVSALMKSLRIERTLLFTCDPYSEIVSSSDRDTALLFGDAATVSCLSRTGAGYALLDIVYGTQPGSASCLVCKDSLMMDGRAVLVNAARNVPESIRTLLDRNELTECDVDAFLLHQGSRYVVDTLRNSMGIDAAKLPYDIEEYGNTVSSSIPILLKQYFAPIRAKLVMSGFGVGFTWASGLVVRCD